MAWSGTANQNILPNPCNPNLNLVFLRQRCLSLLKCCSSMKLLFQIHAQIQKSGLHRDSYVVDDIIQFCALNPFGSLSYAWLLINNSDNVLPSSWNHLIRGYVTTRSDMSREANRVFLEMRRIGIRPNKFTYPFLFKGCAAIWACEEGRQIQVDVIKHGLDSDLYVQNTLIHFYGSCRKTLDAFKVFDEMSLRTVVSWNSIISACVEDSWFYDSIQLFLKMKNCGFEPDETTMVILLSACAEIGNLNMGRWVHCQVIERGLVVNCQLGTALVDMYAKCGALVYASLVFDRMAVRNVWTWSAMILGLAQHGFAKEALELFTKMKNTPIQTNYVTYLGVLCACSHAGLVDDGYRFFYEMEHVHGIRPMMIHHGAMVDILGRAGRLKEAYTYVMNMPTKPDPVVWRTLLSACNVHDIGDYNGVGERVRRNLLELEPRRTGNFVLIANHYAEVGMWDKAANFRNRMRDRGAKKIAGESWIDVGGSIHRFFSGNDCQGACEDVYLLLDGLHMHMNIVTE